MAEKIIYTRDKKRLANMDLKRIDPPRAGEHLEIRDTACDGLRLRVTSKGHRSWCVVYRVAGEGPVGKRGRPGKGKTRRYTLEEPFAPYRDTSQEKMLLMIGPPRSGKGTIQKVLTELVGNSNVCAPSVKALGTPFGLQPLIGKTVAFLSDMRLGGMADGDTIAETLLRITGRDRVTIDRKFKDAWQGHLSTRFVVSSNVLPKLPDASPALANRFSVLRMQQSFLGREDPGLADRLMAELPGVLLWALEGWRRLQDRGRFILPGTSKDAVQELLHLGSEVAAFVHERCELAPGYQIEKDRLYAVYRAWCDRTGRKPMYDTTFATELYAATSNRVSARRPQRSGQRLNVYAGIALLHGGPSPEDDDPY